MKRYRGKIFKKFIDGRIREYDTVEIGNDIETARKKMVIELDCRYDSRIADSGIISIEEDKTPRPTVEFAKEKLLIINDSSRNREEQESAINSLYAAFRTYSPKWDDDELADVLSYCKEGGLDRLVKEYEEQHNTEDGLSCIANELLDELDCDWGCIYRPELPLEEQYLHAISQKTYYAKAETEKTEN